MAELSVEEVFEEVQRVLVNMEKSMRSEEHARQISSGMVKPHRLSICMIVRNEEKLLPACLQSVRSIADEIIIVDTGSNDGTIDAARDFGAKIYHHPWENDFSKHRNQSLAYASGHWILQLDADERLQEDSVAELRQIVADNNEEIGSYLVEIHDCDRRGRRRNFFLSPRLFRNNAGAHYTGEVHNQLSAIGRQVRSHVGIDHVGYDLDPVSMQCKFERTRKLLMRQLERNPNDAFTLLNLTLSYAMQKHVDGVIEFGERLLTCLQNKRKAHPVFLALYHPLAVAWLSKGNYARAQMLANTLLRLVPDSPDGHHLLAWAALLQKDFTGILAHGAAFEESLKSWRLRSSSAQEIECQALGRRSEVMCWMGMANIACGAVSAGQAFLEKGFKDPSFDEHTALNLMRLLGEVQPEVLIEWGPRCVQLFSENVDFIFAALSVLRQSGGVMLMRYCLSVVDLSAMPTDGDGYQLALLYLLREEYGRAAEYLRSVSEESPHYVEAQQQLRYCRERTTPNERAAQAQMANTVDG